MTEAIQALVAEQQDILKKATKTTPSLSRLHQRLIIMERYVIALSRKGVVPPKATPTHEGGVEDVEGEKEEAGEKEELVELIEEVKKEPLIEMKPTPV